MNEENSNDNQPDSSPNEPVDRPYIAECTFCHDGLIRLYHCEACRAVCAICDECELLWRNPEEIASDPNATTDDSFPKCPVCNSAQPVWSQLTEVEIDAQNLTDLVKGSSP